MKIKVGVSNRHVHLNRQDLDILFGEGYEIKNLRALTQKGEFASEETVVLKTEKNTIEKVRILGPVRPYTQVEISVTDSYKLGLKPPVRSSGDLMGSETVTIIGPKGELKKENCCIIANRHIHINKVDRHNLGLDGLDKVSIKIDGEKGGVIDNVYIKEKDTYTLELHLDTDDANAHMLKEGDLVEIVK